MKVETVRRTRGGGNERESRESSFQFSVSIQENSGNQYELDLRLTGPSYIHIDMF